MLGTLQTNIRIDKKQLLYLHRMLGRGNNHWTTKTLLILKDLNIGWYSQIIQTLNRYGLESDFDAIKKYTVPNLEIPSERGYRKEAQKSTYRELLQERK